MRGKLMITVLTIALACGASRKPTPDVTVYLTSAQATPTYLATSQASTMFRTIGVEVAWVTGKPKHPADGAWIEVQLAADTPASLLPDALAESHPYAGKAKAIIVFYDRVQRRAEESGTPERLLLAHVLVHEITHVLERIDRHSASGVMKAHWTIADYAAMACHPLGFDADDIYWIHQHLQTLAAATSRPRAGAN
jgi:hypothetical protein